MLINQEYFEEQLDTLFITEDDFNNSLIQKYAFNKEHDVLITENPMLDESNNIEVVEKLQSKRYNKDVFLYLVKLERPLPVER